MDKKTALYQKHVELGGKMVSFAGYLLPVQYAAGIIKEHNSVRERAGLFDVSHMGEFLLEGEKALSNLNWLLTNDFSSMKLGQVRYSPMCYDNGGVVDDLLVYKSGENTYYIVVNAANREKDFDWMQKHLREGAVLKDISEEVSQLALQGPASESILKKVTEQMPKTYYTFQEDCNVSGINCLISKTGYTGETGYELYCCNKDASRLWDLLMAAGQEEGLMPCGLGARDTLRLEAGMPLYGHELSPDISPKEAGLGFAVKLEKKEFIGKEALEVPASQKRIGLKLVDKGIARAGSAVFSEGVQIGGVTSGTMSPMLGTGIAMAMVKVEFDRDEAQIDVRGRKLTAEVVPLPFYTAKK